MLVFVIWRVLHIFRALKEFGLLLDTSSAAAKCALSKLKTALGREETAMNVKYALEADHRLSHGPQEERERERERE